MHRITSHLRSNDRGNAMFVEPDGMAFIVTQPAHDAWTTADPWGGTNATLPTQAAPQQQQPAMQGAAWGNYNQPQHTVAPPQANPTQNHWPEWGQQATQQRAAESEADTDSNTESSYGEEINYNTPNFAGLTHPQISEKLWWNIARSKSMWRKHTEKPVRKARRFYKRSDPQMRQAKGKRKATIQCND